MNQTSEMLADYAEAAESDVVWTHRVKVFIGLAVLLGAFGYFAFVAFQSATRFYYTVGEMHERGPTDDGQIVRLSGKLVPDSFVRLEGKTVATFRLTDGTQTMPAVIDGVLPDLFFNEHSEVILEGRLRPDGVFESQDVSVKCPSKYVAAS